jgi:hypothetical protein
MSTSWTATDQPLRGRRHRPAVLAGDRKYRRLWLASRPVEQEDAIAGLDRARHPVDDIESATLGYVRDGSGSAPH